MFREVILVTDISKLNIQDIIAFREIILVTDISKLIIQDVMARRSKHIFIGFIWSNGVPFFSMKG